MKDFITKQKIKVISSGACVRNLVRDICAIFWYNRANDGKGAKFGTNDADII